MKFSPILVASIAPTLSSAAGYPLVGCTDLTVHTVAPGDTLTKIADGAKISLELLESFNIAIPNFDSIQINQSILVPNSGCMFDLCPIVKEHVVDPGQNLNGISATYGTTVAAILAVNKQITNANFVASGSVVHIPAPSCSLIHKTVPATDNCVDNKDTPKTYTVVQSDTFFTIANQKLGITLGALKDANPDIKNYDDLQIGQTINVPLCRPCVSPTSKEYGNGVYTVVERDTFLIIAHQKLNITLQAFKDKNPQVPNFDQISVNEKLNVPICAPGSKARRSYNLF